MGKSGAGSVLHHPLKKYFFAEECPEDKMSFWGEKDGWRDNAVEVRRDAKRALCIRGSGMVISKRGR